MSNLEEARRDFYAALDGLRKVHTHEELEFQKEKVNASKKLLLEIDPEFRATIEERKQQARVRAGQMTNLARSKAEGLRRDAEGRVEDFVQKHRFKTRTPEEAEDTVNDGLICPICHGPDRGNIMNGEPFCFGCMHKLVPKSELRNYNRAYRRKWKRR